MRKNFILGIFLSLFISLLFLYNPVKGQAVELVFDDFNNHALGSNLGGEAGAMSYDESHDPQLTFVGNPLTKEGAYALKVTYSFPSGNWCGYWSFTNGSESSSYNVSGYTDIRLWVKGQAGGEKFKLELKDASNNVKAVDVTELTGFSQGLTTAYQEAVFPLALFSGVDMRRLKQVNIVFDKAPYSGTIFVDYIRFTTGIPINPGLPIYDDFNDGFLGPNLDGTGGPMSYDREHDPAISFNGPNAYEGANGIKIEYNVPSGQWVGYWSRWLTIRSLAGYTDLRIWVKGSLGGEKFKIELADNSGNKHAVHITVCPGFENGATTSYREAVIPLATFTGVDLTILKEVNIVFDRAPFSGVVYIDKIYFTNISPTPEPLSGLVLDNFNDGASPNMLGGDCGTMDPEPADSRQTITENYVNDSGFAHEGLGVLKLIYGRGTGNLVNDYVGYWSFMKADKGGYSVSGYTDIRVNVRGNAGNEKFKVELVDNTDKKHVVDIIAASGFSGGVPNSEYHEAILPLALFTGVNLTLLKQVNIIFDQSPGSGTVYLDYIRFTSLTSPPPPPIGLIYDDFNDGVLGSNLGGSAGSSSSDSALLPSVSFSGPNTYEGANALKIDYNVVGAGHWAAYWSMPNAPINISGYTDLRLWIKGAVGGEKFKVELDDSGEDMHAVYINLCPGFANGATTAYQEAVIPFSAFAGADFNNITGINITFDRLPYSGTAYVDLIRFTSISSISPVPDGLIVDCFNNGTFINELGGSSGVMNGDAAATITAQYDPLNKYEGLAGLKLDYNRASSWVGYWTFMTPAGDSDTFGRNFSAYKDLKVWVKGAAGGENFKIELKDANNNKAQSQVLTSSNTFEEKVISLSSFLGIDLAHLKQVSLIFDQVSGAGTIYLDCIRFTGDTHENQIPQAAIDNINPNPATRGQPIVFAGHGTDSDGTVVAYSWRSSLDGQLSTQTSFTKNNLSVGTHTIYFKVQDDDGAWSVEASRELEIHPGSGNIPPIAQVQADPMQGFIPLSVNFIGSNSTDLDGTIISYNWDFGDGSTSNLADVTHIYTGDKTYTATLTVTDNQGATGNGSINITTYEVVPLFSFDDFNDGVLGSNLGGNAGPMSPGGAYDPVLSFTNPNSHEGNYGLSISYNFPNNQWCGYWSLTDQEGDFDVSEFREIRLWAKGESGGEKFKVELKDNLGGYKAVYLDTLPGFSTGLSTGYQEIIIPLSQFGGVDLKHLNLVNIIFDQAPRQGKIFIDYISLTHSTVLNPATRDGKEIWRINCGGEEWMSGDGNIWMKDEAFDAYLRWGYVGGQTSSTAEEISGTDLDKIYQVQREGTGNFSYRINLPKGRYRVTLHFAETKWGNAGERIFDVAIEGNKVLDDLDIFSRVGANAALSYSFDVSVNDEYLDITFPEVKKDKARICGIEAEAVEISEDNFLEFIEKKHSTLFWENGYYNQENGLFSDRYNNWEGGWSAGALDHASIASAGFGLTAICIGESRGWISHSNAYQRVLKTLRTFADNLYNNNGFFYHWLNMSDGSRWENSEVSSIDTTLFLAGALFAGEYFKGTEIETLANSIYRRVNWQWMTPSPPFVSMAWTPEGGFHFARWDYYNEGILLDALAIGSPTYPIDLKAWTEMTRPVGSYAGYEVIHSPGLFTHQYPQLWLDLKNKRDNFADYFQNSINATLIDRQFCIDNKGTYKTYGENSWGLSPGDGPPPPFPPLNYHFYSAPPVYTAHDGTIIPSSAGSSIIFTPDKCIPLLKNLYFQYKHFLWGKFGFCNSYSLDHSWVSPDVIGLDHGALVAAIENYRTGLVWNKFTQISYIKDALNKMGFTNGNNQPPQATVNSITPNPAISGQAVTFTGSGTDSDGTVVACSWRSSLDGQLSTQASFTKSNLSVGTHTIHFKVQDDDNAWSNEVSQSLVVNPVGSNQPPQATVNSITPNPAISGQAVTFTGSGTDSDGTVVACSWRSSLDGQLSTQASFTKSNLSVGTHTIHFKVQDDDNAWSNEVSQSLVVNGNSVNKPPIARAGASPRYGRSPLNVNFSSRGSYDPDGTIASYFWDFMDGKTSALANPTHTYTLSSVRINKIYYARLTVTDNQGKQASRRIRIKVYSSNNRQPIAKARASPRSGRGPLTVRFSSSGSYDPDGKIVSYRWDFGDGKSSRLANPKHIYARNTKKKFYFAQLTVIDDDGANKKSLRLRITVYPRKR